MMLKFILLLRKGVYNYEYVDNLQKFNKIKLPEKECFYSHLNMEDISDVDYTHTKRVRKDFKITYHDLYVKSDTLLLAYVFENFQKMVLKYMILIQLMFLCARISMARSLKKCQSKTRSSN